MLHRQASPSLDGAPKASASHRSRETEGDGAKTYSVRRFPVWHQTTAISNRCALAVSESALDFPNNVLRPGPAESEGAYQVYELVLGDRVGKMNTGQTCGGQQLREAAFCLPGFERRAIQQKFVFGNSQKEGAIGSLGKAFLQFIPGNGELAFGSLVVQAIEPNVLHQYIQTVDERPRGGDSSALVCVGRDDNVTPVNSRYPPRVMRTMRRCTLRR